MKPIICNSESVRTILDGRKTQTRRVIKRVSPRFAQYRYAEGDIYPYYFRRRDAVWDSFKTLDDLIKKYCPYGIPGDKLWVRETWKPFITANSPTSLYDNKAGYGIKYKADGARDFEGFSANIITDLVAKSMRWRSPIYMPRWASRITLEIKDVRVERVQDISEEDARAEGFIRTITDSTITPYAIIVKDSIEPGVMFQISWDSINAKKGYGWEINPFVFVLEFEISERE